MFVANFTEQFFCDPWSVIGVYLDFLSGNYIILAELDVFSDGVSKFVDE
jgi:hypothetical protein